MHHNDFDKPAEELALGSVPPILHFAELLNIFDEILSFQQDRAKQEFTRVKRDQTLFAEVEKVHNAILQASMFMISSFTEFCPCDWGRFPLMDKLISYLEYSCSAGYYLNLMHMVLMIFRISPGKLMSQSVQQLLALFAPALFQLQKESYRLKKLSHSLENSKEGSLSQIIDSFAPFVFQMNLKTEKIRHILNEEFLKPKEQQKMSSPHEIQKNLVENLQLKREIDLYPNGKASKLKFLGFMHFLNFLRQPDLLGELKTHIHIKAYLCRGNYTNLLII